ncbi:XRE family transcriptional regulator (plasmid) [Streptomyces sp. NBC_01591]|uniref:helix-turn-helix domain-containing protein n=1 Tax=Streptomyces sp. NBC_01591 TaxID=2975888 RepID=UPI002DD8C38C|nr:DUF2690 domain-containing protein [Streptomyces sp. NBC_01591]WSD74316.1 XRE family transcriptional regulator [Streptomyces sp. NBC_01591]
MDEGRDETAQDSPAEARETPELAALLNRIRRSMAELGWSYNVMGRRTEVSSSTWNRWCTQGKLPRREALISFADAAPRVVDRTELLGLWDAAWAAQEAQQMQAAAPEPAQDQRRDPDGHTQPAPATATALPDGRRRMTRATLVSLFGIAAAAVGGGAFLLWTLNGNANAPTGTQGAPPATSATASPSPTASCHGSTCASLEPAQSICSKDAVTAYTGSRYGAVIELRYSARCAAAWAKMSRTSPGDRVVITPAQGQSEEYRQQTGHDAHTRMVPADKPENARACAIIQDRGTICTTEPPTAPTATPSVGGG